MEYIYQRRVSFADTDAAGLVHFARLLCYVEEAEHSLLDQLGIPILTDGGWPRVNISCSYLAPVRLGDLVEVVISPEEVGNTSVLWCFLMSSNGKALAKGEVRAVRVDAEGKPTPIIGKWRNALMG